MGEEVEDMEGDFLSNVAAQVAVGLDPAPKQLSSKTLLVTLKPDGGLRDVVTVKCSKINEEAFKGSNTYSEARLKIFVDTLGLPADI